MKPSKIGVIASVLLFLSLFTSGSESEWVSLFDGRKLNDWKASENKDSWKVEDGAIVTNGPRSHLFYNGPVADHNFKNFELSVDVKAVGNSNSGIYFHTEFQEEGWPEKGFECQIVNNTFVEHKRLDHHKNEKPRYIERKQTGSLYVVRNLAKSPVKEGEWFNYRISVTGKTIRVYVNGQLTVNYTEPESPFLGKNPGRHLSSGTFALQGHDPESVVYFKDIKVKILPDDTLTPFESLDVVTENLIRQHQDKNLPMMDLHAHLKGGLTKEQLLEHSRKYGITYGIAFNCGLKMGFEEDDELNEFLDHYEQPQQTYLAMQAEGREWLDLFSKDTIARFDYVFSDAMTWTNDNGKRMRLWIPEETEVGNPQNFMDQLVDRIVKMVLNEPIDIYVNATYLPNEIAGDYDSFWTNERMDKVIGALVDAEVALEISARFKIPSSRFIKKAKQAGVKFTFGTNNTGAHDLGYLEYCIKMAEECQLTYHDFWYPN